MNKCRFCVCGCCTIKESRKGQFDLCPATGCTLFQTDEQQSLSLHKSWQRFQSLPIGQQKDYKNIYYHGCNPWECYKADKT